jgi:hypothetical protein
MRAAQAAWTEGRPPGEPADVSAAVGDPAPPDTPAAGGTPPDASDPGRPPATPGGGSSSSGTRAKRVRVPLDHRAGRDPADERWALTRNPRVLRFWRLRVAVACTLLHQANHAARGRVERLIVPPEVYRLIRDLLDDLQAVAGALDWARSFLGPGVALELEAAALYRRPGATQRDDWSCLRARRKLALLILFCMSPHELEREHVTGSTSSERVLVTAGIPQTLLTKRLIRSSAREPYCMRTLQRDLAEIDECTALLLRWRTPAAKAEAWEVGGSEHGVINRYVLRAAMMRERWRRAGDAATAMMKRTMLRLAPWMVWRPAPARGSHVPLTIGAPAPE